MLQPQQQQQSHQQHQPSLSHQDHENNKKHQGETMNSSLLSETKPSNLTILYVTSFAFGLFVVAEFIGALVSVCTDISLTFMTK